MNITRRWQYLSIPAVVGLGVALISTILLRSEKELEQRRLELEMQLRKKRSKPKQTLLSKSQNHQFKY